MRPKRSKDEGKAIRELIGLLRPRIAEIEAGQGVQIHSERDLVETIKVRARKRLPN